MPTKDGTLSSDDIKRVLDYLNGKSNASTGGCPHCGKTAFSLASKVVAPRTVKIDKGYPLVATSCNNCGYVMFFRLNAVPLPPTKEWKDDDSQS